MLNANTMNKFMNQLMSGRPQVKCEGLTEEDKAVTRQLLAELDEIEALQAAKEVQQEETVEVEPEVVKIVSVECEEEWRDIEGYENLYQVSSFGRVRSLRRNQIIKSRNPLKGDSLGLYLHKNGEKKWHTVQFLVLKTFIGIFNDKYYTMLHLDGDESNNRLDNLMWADELNDIPIYCITTKTAYKSATIAKEIDGYNPKAIIRSCRSHEYYGWLEDGTKCKWKFMPKKLYDKCAKGRNKIDLEKFRSSFKSNR